MDDCIAYVSCAEDHAIAIVAMDRATGALRDIGSVPVPSQPGPGSSMPLAINPDRTVLYAATRLPPFPLASFAIGEGGRLSLLGVAPMAEQFAYLTTDQSGRHILGASYGGALIACNPIDRRGVVRAPSTQVMQTPPRAHSIVTDPSNRFAFVASLGGDCVLRLAFDAEAGTFQLLGSTATKPGAGPRHLRFSPDGRVLYLINELNGSINAYAFDDATGGLAEIQSVSLLPPDAPAKAASADIHITPDGRFLYGSDRTANRVLGFAIDVATGKLSPINAVPTKSAPRGFAIAPGGQFVLCAEQTTRSLAVYAIDQDSGALRQVGAHDVGGGPNWIEFLT